jgi:hypothetical protein
VGPCRGAPPVVSQHRIPGVHVQLRSDLDHQPSCTWNTSSATSPCADAGAVAERVGAPSFASTAETWWSTVLAEMTSRAAISALEWPQQIRSSTSLLGDPYGGLRAELGEDAHGRRNADAASYGHPRSVQSCAAFSRSPSSCICGVEPVPRSQSAIAPRSQRSQTSDRSAANSASCLAGPGSPWSQWSSMRARRASTIDVASSVPTADAMASPRSSQASASPRRADLAPAHEGGDVVLVAVSPTVHVVPLGLRASSPPGLRLKDNVIATAWESAGDSVRRRTRCHAPHTRRPPASGTRRPAGCSGPRISPARSAPIRYCGRSAS